MKIDALIMMIFTLGTVASFTVYFFSRILKNPEASSSSEVHHEGPTHPHSN